MDSRRKTNRRQFLQGKAALNALQNMQWGSADADSPQRAPSSVQRQQQRGDYLMQIGRRAMACEFQVFCLPGRFPGAVEAAAEALDLVDALEDQLTVYREHSEIMHINQTAQHEACPVEPRLFELLCRCVAWSQTTQGAFDITAGPLVKLWGFYTRQGRFPQTEEVQGALRQVGSTHLELDSDRMTIRFGQPGMELNLGSVGKGYALDRSAELLEAAGVCSFMFHGGQSSILARGVRSEATEGREEEPWSVALRHPLRPERRLAELVVRDRALGTSGSGQQFFYHQDGVMAMFWIHAPDHLLKECCRLLCWLPCAAEADALATTFLCWGSMRRKPIVKTIRNCRSCLFCLGPNRARSLSRRLESMMKYGCGTNE